MIYFPALRLPEYFTHLLKASMTADGDSFNQLKEYIWQNPSLQAICKKSFKSISPDFNLEVIIKALGWHGMRDRIAASFIEYSLDSQFNEDADTSHIRSAIELEERMQSLSVSGNSRIFLFAFYMKMALISECKINPSKQHPDLIIKDKHLKYLELARSRVISIDWLLLLIIHLENYLGERKLKEVLTDDDILLDDILLMLSLEQKENMVSNFLNYASSISEKSIFLDERV